MWSDRTPEEARRIADSEITRWLKDRGRRGGPEGCRDKMIKAIAEENAYRLKREAKHNQEQARIHAEHDADRFPFIWLGGNEYKYKGRGKPRPGQHIEYFTAAEATERGLELPSLDTAA